MTPWQMAMLLLNAPVKGKKQRRCIGCGQRFTETRVNKVYCSTECSNALAMKRRDSRKANKLKGITNETSKRVH